MNFRIQSVPKLSKDMEPLLNDDYIIVTSYNGATMALNKANGSLDLSNVCIALGCMPLQKFFFCLKNLSFFLRHISAAVAAARWQAHNCDCSTSCYVVV